MRLLLVLLVLLPGAGFSQERALLPRECRVERMAFALAACLDHAADRAENRMNARIAAATSDLQYATGPELVALDRGLRRAQANWRLAVVAACEVSSSDQVGRAFCRWEATRLRAERVEEMLADLRTRMGADPLYPVPDTDAVEVLIPLELPPGIGGPDADVRVPLTVPITPQ